MDRIEIYVRIRDKDDLEKIELYSNPYPGDRNEVLWESNGEYMLEVFQHYPYTADFSIEKDIRILNPKNEIVFMLLESLVRRHTSASLSHD
jgi:hypothetical protein